MMLAKTASFPYNRGKEVFLMTFYRCEHCGNIIAYINDSGVRAQCCGEEMKPIEPNTTDAAGEKHVPVIEQNGQTVTVTVGSVEHPMLDAHYIEWILLETEQGFQIHYLKPGMEPEATFKTTEKVIAAFEYCNLHGLWKAEA